MAGLFVSCGWNRMQAAWGISSDLRFAKISCFSKGGELRMTRTKLVEKHTRSCPLAVKDTR